MHPIPHCVRCGYANVPAWIWCRCCGRVIEDCPRRSRRRRPPRRYPDRHRIQWRHPQVLSRLRVTRTEAKEDLAEILAAW